MSNKIIKNNLIFEVKRIHNLMGVTHNEIILENVAFTNFVKILVNKFGDDITKLTSKITKKDIPFYNSIINKLKSSVSLSNDEFNFLARYLSWDKTAENAITKNDFFGQSFIDGIRTSIKTVEANPSKYDEQLTLWENLINNSEYNFIPKTIKDKIKEKIKVKFSNAVNKANGVTPGKNVIGKIITQLPVDFTKFVKDSVTEMTNKAKKVNENINILKQGGLDGDQIKNLENQILKDMQDIFYGDRNLIDYMKNELSDGVKNNTGNTKKAFEDAKAWMDKLEKQTTEKGGMAWISGPLAKNITNKWSVFIKETLRESFGEWYWLARRIIKSKPVKTAKEFIDNINGIEDNLVKNTTKKNVGSSANSWGKRQAYLTLIGSGRGIPLKSSSNEAYEEIIKAFPKNSLNYARASLLVEKIIKVIKMTIYIQIFRVIQQFFGFGNTDKKLQKKYGPCIDELTKILENKQTTIDKLTPADLPQCLIDLMNNKTIDEGVINGIMIRANFFANEEGVIDGLINKFDLLPTLINFVFGSRLRLATDIYTIITNWTESLRTGDDAIIDKYISDLTTEVQKLKTEINPFEVTGVESTVIPPNNDLKFTNDIPGLVKWLTDVKKLNIGSEDLPYIKSVGNNTYTFEDAEKKIYTYEYSGNTFQVKN
jgi:hypothetical protein